VGGESVKKKAKTFKEFFVLNHLICLCFIQIFPDPEAGGLAIAAGDPDVSKS
jgi:hypothetical protein